MNSLQLSFKNTIAKPLNMILSLILFGFGVGLILFLLHLSEQVQQRFEKNLANIDLVLGAKGSPLQLVLSSMYHLDSPTGNIKLSEVRPFLNPQHPLIAKAVPISLGDNIHGYRIVGTDTSFLGLYQATCATGRIWQQPFEVVLGATLAKALKLNLGDTFSGGHGLADDEDQLHKEAAPYKVVGILNENGSVIDQLAVCDKSTTWAVHEAPHHEHEHEHETENHTEQDSTSKEITNVLIRFKSKTNYQALLMPRMINQNTNMQAASPAMEMNRLYALMGVGEQGLRNLALAIMFVSGLSIFIALYSSLKERRYELALLRIMGASRFRVMSMILLEGIWLALLGFGLGLVLSRIGLYFANKSMNQNYHYRFETSLWGQYEWFLLGISLVIGIVAALIPAIKIFNTNLSKTLSER
jgi:putative ABC transport system permease protein